MPHMLNTNDWLSYHALSSPQKVALIERKQRWTYVELNEIVAQTASRLLSAGVRPDQRVAVLMGNCATYVFLVHALMRVGAVLIPLNVRLTVEELRCQIEQSRCELLICDEQAETQAAVLLHSDLRVIPLSALNRLPTDLTVSGPSHPLRFDDLQSIVYTSGTTGRSKGAMLTYGNQFWSATASAFRLGTLPHDRWLLCMPLYHVGGLAIALRCCLYGTTIVLQNKFDPQAVQQAIETEQVTLVSLVPTMLHRLFPIWEKQPPPASLRCVLLGGATAPKPLLERAIELGLSIATTYGLTEAASQVTTQPPGEVFKKRGSVGKPLMFSQVHIVDDQGRTQPTGETGEIVVQGPTVMQGYEGQSEATEKTLKDGKLHTGDLGYLDEDGDLWVVRRRTDLIVTGGENVYPTEVEQVLLQHPDVVEACVVGVDDAEWGQRVAAAIIRSRSSTVSETDLGSFCKGKLAGYKQPRVFRFYDQFPQTASGKIDRKSIAKQISEHT